MWFQLNTTFSTHLGALSTLQSNYGVTYSLSNFTKTTAPDMVEKDKSLTVVLTMAEGATFSSASMTDGTNTVTGNLSGNTVTMTINSVKGPVTVTARATVAGIVEPDDEPGGGNGGESTIIAIAYTSRQSASGISKTTGEYLSSSTGYVNIYDNIDPTKNYCATSYAPGSSGDNACVCYYTSDGTFISAESGSDWGISSAEYTNHSLTVPSNAYTIKLFGRTNNQEAVLSIVSGITQIAHSAINEKSNLNKTDGTIGSSPSGVVKTYNNIDALKTYLADGFCPNATGTAAFVCYYNNANTFISAQDGNDFGLSSKAASKVILTIPSGTATIKLFGQSGTSDPYLYISD